MANGLRKLIAANSSQPNVKLNAARLAVNSATNRVELVPGKSNFISDLQNRVLVRVVLNGTLDAAAVSSEIEKSGGKVVATSAYGRGVIGAFIPLANAASIAGLAGVQALHLTYKPIQNVGAVTAQSVVALDVNKVLAEGINGKHVTVGIISDSYDTSGNKDTAATDVATGDLPNTTKIKGGEGLKALIQDDFKGGTDEGRGMAQIVHDMAPGADLCFATGDFGQEGFAANIYALASDQGPCKADIILDDEFYSAEPFFSDGLITAAVDRVSTIPRSDGSRVTYLSAAGNDQDAGYDAFFNALSPKNALALSGQAVDLSTIPTSVDVGGGFHNFGTANSPVIAQPLLIQGNPFLILQWNDPFDVGKITSSYSLLLFDQNGKYIKASDTLNNASSDDDAFQTDEPIQGISFDTTATKGQAFYYLVIARRAQGTYEAKRLRWLSLGNAGVVIAAYQTISTPVTFGHPTAKHAIGVAAYNVNRAPFSADPPYTPEIEYFSSVGPFFNYFDDNGNRLAQPEIRQKPDLACTDGLFTTFFGQQFLPTDAFPRFFGTSAAAPCAGGIAALVIQKAMTGSNPRHPSPEEVRQALLSSTGVHDTDPFYSQGEVQVGSSGFLRVMVRGNDNTIGDPTNFRVWLHGADGWQLSALTLHIPAYDDLAFFQTTSFPFTVGDTSPGVQVSLLNLVPPAGQSYAESFDLQLGFKGFNSGDYVDFDDDRGDTAFGYIDDDADRVGGTTFTAVLSKGNASQIVSGVISNREGTDWWTHFDGYGLINADLAVANTK